MNSADSRIRYDELSAGRAMGDLSHEEGRELSLLEQELSQTHDFAFDLMVGALTVDFLKESLAPLPADLAARMHRCADDLHTPAPDKVIPFQPTLMGKIICSPFTGWVAAAVIGLLAVVTYQAAPQQTPSEAHAILRTEAPDLLERSFQGLGTYTGSSGNVIWSDAKQAGYMTLAGLPVNDPTKAQYQLWIVDPKRDEAPIDGGVFDIVEGGVPNIVPIAAKLSLTDPQAFVITLEQPGGVVKSKQEHLVALAKY